MINPGIEGKVAFIAGANHGVGAAAAELGKYGITVKVLALGPIQTGRMTTEQAEAIAAGTPLGRCGTPEDVADVIGFLASEQSHWITGQLIYVGGGWRMHQ